MEKTTLSEVSGRDHMLKFLKLTSADVPDDELAQKIGQKFVAGGIIGSPIRFVHGDAYYFDENQIYRKDPGAKRFPEIMGRPYMFARFKLWVPNDNYHFHLNQTLWSKAVACFEVGDRMEECIRNILLETKVRRYAYSYSDAERLVTRIESPLFEREPGNDNADTFDRIRVSVGLPKYLFETREELVAAVKEHRKEISKMVLEKIEGSKSFQRYGVPINFLRTANITLCRDYSLEYIFEPRMRTTEREGYPQPSPLDNSIADAKARVKNAGETTSKNTEHLR